MTVRNGFSVAGLLLLLLLAAPVAADHPAAPVPAEPIEVRVALQLDQISDVNQKEENFTIVGNLLLGWDDPAYAFDPVECGCDEKTFNARQFEDYAKDNSLRWPQFLFYNQQGNRWVQERIFIVKHDGEAGYVERFSVTLQAPDFNFLKYPFDTQKFNVHVLSLFREHLYRFEDDPDFGRMGTQLGEEEWLAGPYRTTVESVVLGKKGGHSQFTFTFQAKRQVDYYVYRIFLPLCILSVSPTIISSVNGR